MTYRLYTKKIEQRDGQSRRDAERAATEALVVEVFGDKAMKTNDEAGAPVLMIDGQRVDAPISISHSRTTAVLAVGEGSASIGVDIEGWRPQLRRVVPKFLSDEEALVYVSNADLLRAWTLKEAAFKAALTPGLVLADFRLPLDGSDRIVCGEREFAILESRACDEEYISVVAVSD